MVTCQETAADEPGDTSLWHDRAHGACWRRARQSDHLRADRVPQDGCGNGRGTPGDGRFLDAAGPPCSAGGPPSTRHRSGKRGQFELDEEGARLRVNADQAAAQISRIRGAGAGDMSTEETLALTRR